LFIRHYIDAFNSLCIAGWIFKRWYKAKPVRLTFKSGKGRIGTTTADIYRKDLQIKKAHPTGRCGFNFNFPADTDITAAPTLDIYLEKKKKPFLQLSTSGLTRTKFRDLPQILFMHIPKTAGTSFNAFMRMHVPLEKSKTHLESISSSSEYRTLRETHSYLAGHLTLEKLTRDFDLSRFDLFSIIRNPYKHLHSHLNWLKGIGAHAKSGFFEQHNPSIQQLANKINHINFKNKYEIQSFVDGIHSYEFDLFDNCQTRYFLTHRSERVCEQDLEQAFKNLEKFIHVGRTETYSDFISSFTRHYQLSHDEEEKMGNRAIEPPLYNCMDEEIQEIVSPLTCFDKRLYKKVKDVFG